MGEDEPEEEDQVDGESTDSMVSAAQLSAAFASPSGVPLEAVDATTRSPYIKRVSNTGGAIFYQARPLVSGPPTAAEELLLPRGRRTGSGLGQLVTGGLPTQECGQLSPAKNFKRGKGIKDDAWLNCPCFVFIFWPLTLFY